MANGLDEINKLAQIAELITKLKVNSTNTKITLYLLKNDYNNMLAEVMKMTKVKFSDDGQTNFSMFIDNIEFVFFLV